MRDEGKTKEQLISELTELRQRIAELEAADTERVRAEEALQRQREELQVILDSVPALIFYKDKENRFIRVNKACAELLGKSKEKLESKSCFEIFPRDQAEDFWRDDKEVIASEHARKNIIEPIETPEGTMWVQTDKIPYRDEKGNIVGVIGFAVDITERKQAEEELQRLYEQARRDAETKATLLQEVNHRVRNNLLAIIGLLYTERRYAETTDQAAYRAITQNLMNRVNGLTTVHSLLAASEWAPLLLSDLAGQVVRSSLQMLPRDKGVSVKVPPSPVRVTPDQAHNLALAINELTTNTVKYAVQGRDTAHIAFGISLEDGDDTVRLEFRDDGPGYPEDVLQLERYRAGFDLIQKMVRQGLRGELSLHNDEGAVAVIRFKAQA